MLSNQEMLQISKTSDSIKELKTQKIVKETLGLTLA